MKSGLVYSVFVLALGVSVSTSAAVINVPADQPTIQAGIDVAVDSAMIYSAWVASHEFIARNWPDSGFICFSSFSPFSDYAAGNPPGRSGFRLDSIPNGNFMAQGYALRDTSVNGFFAYWCEMSYDSIWNLVDLSGVQAGAWFTGSRDRCDCNPDRGFVSDTTQTILVPGWFLKIQSAINCAVDGDTVLVAPGSYTENLTYPPYRVSVISAKGADSTFLFPSFDSVMIKTTPGVSTDSGSCLKGFSFAGISIVGVQPNGASINLIQIGGTFSGDIVGEFRVVENKFLYCNVQEMIRAGTRAKVIVEKNLFKSCGPSFPIVVQHAESVVRWNTLDSCAEGIISSGSTSVVTNNIVSNIDPGVTSGAAIFYNRDGVNYNCAWQNPVDTFLGPNGFVADPQFVNPSINDYRLKSTSPCIDAGDPDPTLNDADGTRSDIGAFPFLQGIRVESIFIGPNENNLLNHYPLFQWNNLADGQTSQTSFEIAVGTDTIWTIAEMWNPAPVASSDTFVTYAGAPLIDGQTYYLRLRVNNSLVWSDWFETSFRMNSVPSVPRLRRRVTTDRFLFSRRHFILPIPRMPRPTRSAMSMNCIRTLRSARSLISIQVLQSKLTQRVGRRLLR